MMDMFIAKYHLHPIIDHFTIALCSAGVLVDILGYFVGATIARRSARAWELGERLSRAALVLLIPGAISAVLSRLTGEREAERVWDSISAAAQQILLSDAGRGWFLSHAVLGTYLMYALLALAIWRMLLEASATIARTRSGYALTAVLVLCALLYQGRTGGELVYDHGVGTNTTTLAPTSSLH
ncbi:MAG: DUF2231 domain-containing protein [Deltaproteobacteria bacterium]|nr:DUF2231 domain-containing protein [Deltaproteobacteria bacterium]